jgi:hypothetical protein
MPPVSAPVPASDRVVERRLIDLLLPSSPLRSLTTPGAARLLELRWAALIRRAPVMTPEEHAAAVADPARRGAEIEVPTACLLCGGERLQTLFHPHDRKNEPPRWDYHFVRCAGCGLLFRHPASARNGSATCTRRATTPRSSPAGTRASGSAATTSR